MNANSISLHRLKNLFYYEWAMDRRFYLLGTLGLFMISFSMFLTTWFNNISGFVWRTVDYNSIFYGGFVFLSVFGISQSFIELREKNAAIRYLTLPASAVEKYFIQIFLRMVLPLIIYPVVFWIGANLSVDVYYFIQHSLLEKTALPVIHKVELLYLYWIPNVTIDIGYWGLFGLMLSLPILMFMGGIIFGKWSFIAMPFSILLYIALIFGGCYPITGLFNSSNRESSRHFLPIGNPEVFEGVPLLVLVCVFLIWTAVFLPFLVTYLKLKEREV